MTIDPTPIYLSAAHYRAEWLRRQLPDYLALTQANVLEAVEAGVVTVHEQADTGWYPNLDNDSAWEIVLPETLLYLSDAHNIDMSTFDHIAY